MRCDGVVTRGRLLERPSNAPVSEPVDHLLVDRLSGHRDSHVGRSNARLQLLEILQLVLKRGRNRLALAVCTHDTTPMSTAPSCTLIIVPRLLRKRRPPILRYHLAAIRAFHRFCRAKKTHNRPTSPGLPCNRRGRGCFD